MKGLRQTYAASWTDFGYPDETDIDDRTRYFQGDADIEGAALKIRKASTAHEIASAVAIDEAHTGSKGRADYIASVAESGGLSVAVLGNAVQAFCCLDHNYFFEKPFISLLIVSADARRRGLGAGLLAHSSRPLPEVWTSTNRSNAAMRALLEKQGWHYCGELNGLDDGDPEQFFRTA